MKKYDDTAIINQRHWEKLVKEGCGFTRPWLNLGRDVIKKYADNAAFSALKYDRNEEEELVQGIFKDSILDVADFFAAPYRVTDRLLRFLSSHDVFESYMTKGLKNDILAVEGESKDRLFKPPHSASWERVVMKLPRM